MSREDALMHSLISTHTILGVENGKFVSLFDPPESMAPFAARCQNKNAWPVLVGDDGSRDMMLSSPIILYDYPQIAPESPGDLFDGTEIDEILALRIMTMTDDEKREVRQSDPRGRELLERTEALPPEHLMKLHGVLRGLRSSQEKPS
jgi:hydrogenase maturation protease